MKEEGHMAHRVEEAIKTKEEREEKQASGEGTKKTFIMNPTPDSEKTHALDKRDLKNWHPDFSEVYKNIESAQSLEELIASIDSYKDASPDVYPFFPQGGGSENAGTAELIIGAIRDYQDTPTEKNLSRIPSEYFIRGRVEELIPPQQFH